MRNSIRKIVLDATQTLNYFLTSPIAFSFLVFSGVATSSDGVRVICSDAGDYGPRLRVVLLHHARGMDAK